MLQTAYRFLWRLQAGGRLLSDRGLDMEAIGEGGRAFLLRETGASDLYAMASQLAAHGERAGAIVSRILSGA